MGRPLRRSRVRHRIVARQVRRLSACRRMVRQWDAARRRGMRPARRTGNALRRMTRRPRVRGPLPVTDEMPCPTHPLMTGPRRKIPRRPGWRSTTLRSAVHEMPRTARPSAAGPRRTLVVVKLRVRTRAPRNAVRPPNSRRRISCRTVPSRRNTWRYPATRSNQLREKVIRVRAPAPRRPRTAQPPVVNRLAVPGLVRLRTIRPESCGIVRAPPKSGPEAGRTRVVRVRGTSRRSRPRAVTRRPSMSTVRRWGRRSGARGLRRRVRVMRRPNTLRLLRGR